VVTGGCEEGDYAKVEAQGLVDELLRITEYSDDGLRLSKKLIEFGSPLPR
jgi:hypothetical protein